MMTVHEVSKISGVSIRALHHYDNIGLLKYILDSPDFDRGRALEQQIHLLELRREHLQKLIDLARGIKMIGVNYMNFKAFDTKKIDEYARQAKASWGQTDAYKEYKKKSAGWSREEQHSINVRMMEIFSEFGKIKDQSPEGEAAGLYY